MNPEKELARKNLKAMQFLLNKNAIAHGKKMQKKPALASQSTLQYYVQKIWQPNDVGRPFALEEENNKELKLIKNVTKHFTAFRLMINQIYENANAISLEQLNTLRDHYQQLNFAISKTASLTAQTELKIHQGNLEKILKAVEIQFIKTTFEPIHNKIEKQKDATSFDIEDAFALLEDIEHLSNQPSIVTLDKELQNYCKKNRIDYEGIDALLISSLKIIQLSIKAQLENTTSTTDEANVNNLFQVRTVLKKLELLNDKYNAKSIKKVIEHLSQDIIKAAKELAKNLMQPYPEGVLGGAEDFKKILHAKRHLDRLGKIDKAITQENMSNIKDEIFEREPITANLLLKIAKLQNQKPPSQEYLVITRRLRSEKIEKRLLNASTIDKDSILMLSIRNHLIELTKVLIDLGANVNHTNHEKETSLHEAVFNHDLETVKLLFQKEIKVNYRNQYNTTPLMMAAANGTPDIVAYLLSHAKHDQNSLNEALFLTMDKTESEAHLKIAKLLIQHGANINSRNPVDDYTQLMQAAANGNIATTKMLLEQKVDFGTVHSTMVDTLARSKFYNKNMIIHKEIDIPIPYIRKTALSLAVENEHIDIVKMLLEKNKQLEHHSQKGVRTYDRADLTTALLIAAEKRNEELIILIAPFCDQEQIDYVSKKSESSDNIKTLLFKLRLIEMLKPKGSALPKNSPKKDKVTFAQQHFEKSSRKQQLALFENLENDLQATLQQNPNDLENHLKPFLGALNYLAWQLKKETRISSSPSRLEAKIIKRKQELEAVCGMLNINVSQDCNEMFYHQITHTDTNNTAPYLKAIMNLGEWQVQGYPDGWQTISKRQLKNNQ